MSKPDRNFEFSSEEKMRHFPKIDRYFLMAIFVENAVRFRGLDSSSCMQCVQLLKELTRQGRTIICTIHQPSASLFQLFDLVYILSRGHCLYQGTTGNLIPFLENRGMPCPKYHNPADYGTAQMFSLRLDKFHANRRTTNFPRDGQLGFVVRRNVLREPTSIPFPPKNLTTAFCAQLLNFPAGTTVKT